ncbi:MAG TPA: hypothetical protein VGB91_17500 [Rhizomicrobium sp.]
MLGEHREWDEGPVQRSPVHFFNDKPVKAKIARLAERDGVLAEYAKFAIEWAFEEQNRNGRLAALRRDTETREFIDTPHGFRVKFSLSHWDPMVKVFTALDFVHQPAPDHDRKSGSACAPAAADGSPRAIKAAKLGGPVQRINHDTDAPRPILFVGLGAAYYGFLISLWHAIAIARNGNEAKARGRRGFSVFLLRGHEGDRGIIDLAMLLAQARQRAGDELGFDADIADIAIKRCGTVSGDDGTDVLLAALHAIDETLRFADRPDGEIDLVIVGPYEAGWTSTKDATRPGFDTRDITVMAAVAGLMLDPAADPIIDRIEPTAAGIGLPGHSPIRFAGRPDHRGGDGTRPPALN